MSKSIPIPISRALPFLLSLMAWQSASAAGIRVRFLASPPEDSVVRYDIWRRDPSVAASVKVGSLPAGTATDTLSFPDSTARKGVAYLYCLRAVNAAGLESDPSDSALVAQPRLALPDSVRPIGGQTRLPLAPDAHPLAGHSPLVLSLADSSRLRIVHDTVSGSVLFLSPTGIADTATAVIRAAYHGKFCDLDTVLVMVAARATYVLAPPLPPNGTSLAAPALRRAAGSGALVLAVPSRQGVRLLRPDGRLAP